MIAVPEIAATTLRPDGTGEQPPRGCSQQNARVGGAELRSRDAHRAHGRDHAVDAYERDQEPNLAGARPDLDRAAERLLTRANSQGMPIRTYVALRPSRRSSS